MQLDYSQNKVRQLNKYEDILDVFMHIIILRLPSGFVLVNMTLMIWLVQTIFSDYGSDSIPDSFYLYAPMLGSLPVIDIKVKGENQGCDTGYEKIVLSNFPNLRNQSIKHANLTKWKQSMNICMLSADQNLGFPNFSIQCNDNLVYCSGFCVNSVQKCPITSIKRVQIQNTITNTIQASSNTNTTTFYSNLNYSYIYSKQSKSSFIVDIISVLPFRCNNDYHYFDNFQTFSQYWNQTQECGDEGILGTDLFQSFDSMSLSDYWLQNGIWLQEIQKYVNNIQVDLGALKRISFSRASTMCKNIEQNARELSKQMLYNFNQPQFSKNLLIMSFVLFLCCVFWLFAQYCCCEGRLFQKNITIILLIIVQLIAFGFIYSQISQLLSIQSKISAISSCIQQSGQPFNTWTFTNSIRYPLIGIMYASVCFILLQIVCYYVICCLYQPYGGNVQGENVLVLTGLSPRGARE